MNVPLGNIWCAISEAVDMAVLHNSATHVKNNARSLAHG